MKDLEFIRDKITSYFLDFIPLKQRHKIAQREIRKTDRKLKTFDNRYGFLLDIIKVGSDGEELVLAIKKLLKDAGFEKVIHYKDKRQRIKREDIQARSENDVFIIEVKGTKAVSPKRYDLLQIFPYVQENKIRQANKNIYGLTIINHNNGKEINQRLVNFASEENAKDLKNSYLGSISAINLLIHFSHLKRGLINFETFKNDLKKTGILTYGSNGGKTLKE